MKETKLAQTILEPGREEDLAHAVEIRTLDELELALAGGGDNIPEWP